MTDEIWVKSIRYILLNSKYEGESYDGDKMADYLKLLLVQADCPEKETQDELDDNKNSQFPVKDKLEVIYEQGD